MELLKGNEGFFAEMKNAEGQTLSDLAEIYGLK